MNTHYMQGGGNSRAYTAPRMETLEVSAEKGFAASSDITGDDMFGQRIVVVNRVSNRITTEKT